MLPLEGMEMTWSLQISKDLSSQMSPNNEDAWPTLNESQVHFLK